MKILKRKSKSNNYGNKVNKKGFTLIEMVVTIVVLAIITAVAIPSVYAYMEKGKQTERDNIARTLFLSAQSQLLEKKVTKSLASFVSEGALEVPTGLVTWDKSIATTTSIGAIKYIVKEKSDTLDGDNPVVKLFKGNVIDEDILKNSICVEFDEKTGAVLSVFYSVIGENLDYSGEGANNISGDRPYTHKKERKQGYYGGEGVPSGTELGPIKISLYDGMTRPLYLDGTRNILYAEITFSGDAQYGDYLLQVLDKNGNEIKDVDPITFKYNKNAAPEDLSSAKKTSIRTDKPLIYKSYKTPDNVYIWVIDIFAEDSFNANPFSIGGRYGDLDLKPQDIKVSIADAKAPLNKSVSDETVNSHFGKEVETNSGVTYQVASARHLYNLRYKLDGEFKQIKNIDFAVLFVENFLPIGYRWEYENGKDVLKTEAFSGVYDGMDGNIKQYRIANLKVKSTDSKVKNIGLFGTVDGEGKENKGIIKGVSIIRGNIETTVNGKIGAIAGEVIDGKISLCNSISNVLAGKDKDLPAAKGPDNIIAGGLVGSVGKNAIVEQSYNGGYYYAADEISDTPYGKVGLSGVEFKVGNMGGIAGENSGTIDSVYNNARVQINAAKVDKITADGYLSRLLPEAGSYTVFDMEAGLTANMGGLVGVNKGKISNGYATNFVGKTKQNGIVTDKNCKTGGIIGLSDKGTETSVYYLPNGEATDAGGLEVSKEELSGVTSSAVLLGDKFNAKARGYKGPGSTGNQFYETYEPDNPGPSGKITHHNYAYPTLRNNFHRTPWEDIGYEKVQDKFNVKYYEIYDSVNPKTEGKYGLWSPENDQLANDKKVLQEGYALFSGTVDIDGNSTKMIVYDAKNGNKLIEKKAGTETSIEQIPGVKCIVFDMIELEDAGLGLKPLYVKIGKGNADKADYFEGYINPLFAKAIYEENPTASAITNYVRSPRHLDNVDFTRLTPNSGYVSPLNGNFVQDTTVDFTNLNQQNGYKKIKDASKAFSQGNVEVMNFNRTVVASEFKGVYDGYGNGKINSIVGFANTAEGWDAKEYALFSNSSGKIKGLIIDNFLINSKQGTVTAALVGINSGVIGGETKNESIEIKNTKFKGSDNVSNLGMLVGKNEEKGKIYNVTVKNSQVTEFKNEGQSNIGGLVGLNYGMIGSSSVGITISGVEINSCQKSGGGLAGHNGATGKIINAAVESTTVNAVSGGGTENFGGMVGLNDGTVGSTMSGVSVSTTTVNGAQSYAGGLGGQNSATGIVVNATAKYVSINSNGIDRNSCFGGMVGLNMGVIGTTNAGVSVFNSSVGKAQLYTGGIAGRSDGTNARINSAMVVDTELKGSYEIGGIVGENRKGSISNVYISHTSGAALRSPQTENYISPTKIFNIEDSNRSGGLVGAMNGGKIINAYMAAPVVGKMNTIAGGVGTAQINMENVYYLVGYDFNDNLEADRKQGTPLISTALAGMTGSPPFSDGNGWTKAKGDYPYPVLKNLPESKTWCAEISLAYYEKYAGDTKLYKWLSGKYDELKDNSVEEDGYAVIGLPRGYGNFAVEADGQKVSGTPTDGTLILDSAFLAGITQTSNQLDIPVELKLFNNKGDDTKLKDTYFIPTFAKQIYRTARAVDELEIRSPRHFKNVYGFASNSNYSNAKGKTFKQTKDIDFNVYKTNGNKVAITEGERSKEFYGIYDGEKKSGVSTIKNVVGTSTGAIGGLFAGNGEDSAIKNLILDNFKVTGGAVVGGLVQINNGTIENISLRNSSIYGQSDVGGIVAVNYNIMKQCSVIKSLVESKAGAAGGIAAKNHNIVENVYVYSNGEAVTGGAVTGGFFGKMEKVTKGGVVFEPTLKNAYYAAKLPTPNKLLIGDLTGSGSDSTKNVYLLVDVGLGMNIGQTLQNMIKGTILDSAELENIYLPDLGNSNVWQYNVGGKAGHYYPILKFEAGN